MEIPTHKECQLIPSRSAMKEMYDLGFDLFMVAEILEEGYDCSRSKRTAGTIERCIDRGGKTVNYQPLKGLAFVARAGSLPRQPCT